MNIFYLDNDQVTCAKYHTDRHVVKMILEYAQLLSTAHRVLDGTLENKKYVFNDIRDEQYYKATHVNHPSAIWVRQSKENYLWLAKMFIVLCVEYTHRYGKAHKTFVERTSYLSVVPNSIPEGDFSEPTLAMPDDCRCDSAIDAYRKYYNVHKRHLFSWKNRDVPSWIIE